MPWWKPNTSSSATSASDRRPARSTALLMRCETICSPASSDIASSPAPGPSESISPSTASIRKPSTSSTDSTSNRSADSSRNTPLMPVCDAMAWMRIDMLSNSGPEVSARTKRRCRRYASKLTGSRTCTQARGFSSRFCRVLLKNWQLSATWVGST
jgi:hypothetical protein